MNNTTRMFVGAVLVAAVVGSGMNAYAQQRMGMGHGMGSGHGMTRMLQGVDTTTAEVNELREMFMNHHQISRSVTNLPNGIRTVTESENPELAALIVSHVIGMNARVQDGKDR